MLVPGTYNQAGGGQGHPLLDVFGNGRGDSGTGKFTVLEAVYDTSGPQPVLLRFAANFVQYGQNSSSALTGTIYYRSNTHPQIADTSHPDTTASLSGTVGKYGRYAGPVQVALSATDPDGAGDVAATYYTLDGGAQQTYTAPFTVSADGLHAVRYYSVDRTGNQEASKLRSIWIDTSPATTAPAQTHLIMHSAPGDYIGQGKDYLYTDQDGQFIATSSTTQPYGQTGAPVNSIQVSFNGANYGHTWTLQFSTAQLGIPIAVGSYENAQEAVTESRGHPGLAVFGDGRGDTVTGKFTISDLVLDYSTSATQPQVVSFAASFEQHSAGAIPALTGTIFYHSTAYVGTPATVTFSPSTVMNGQRAIGTVTLASPAPAGGELVTLSGSSPEAAGVPVTVTVPAGAAAASFSVATSAVGAETNIAVTASANGVTSAGTLTVEPMSNWSAVSIATGPDEQTRVLWNNADGRMTLWTLGTNNSLNASPPVFGPYAGWTAKAISVGPDNNTHILWDNTDGRMTLWTLNSNDQLIGSFPVFGPYSGWTAKGISAGPDGDTHILWDNSDGHMTPWTLDANNTLTGNFPVFGPYAGWTATSIATGLDNKTHILWNNIDGRMTPWSLGADNQPTGSFAIFGPYNGWSALGISGTSTGGAHILWDNINGQMTPWTLNSSSQQTGNFPVFRPF